MTIFQVTWSLQFSNHSAVGGPPRMCNQNASSKAELSCVDYPIEVVCHFFLLLCYFFFLVSFFLQSATTRTYISRKLPPPFPAPAQRATHRFWFMRQPNQSDATCTLEQSLIKIIPARPARPHTSAAGEARAGRLVLPIAWVRR